MKHKKREKEHSQSVIRIEGLSRTYKMGSVKVHALENVSFEVKINEYLAIMGHSGSGKSTLMNLLRCLDQADAGTYILGGVNTTKMSDSRLADIRNRQIGFVFQSFELLSRVSAQKNVELPLIYSNYSIWSRRKMARRALVNNPNILLADEPTGNLDCKTSESIMKLFERLHNEGQ